MCIFKYKLRRPDVEDEREIIKARKETLAWFGYSITMIPHGRKKEKEREKKTEAKRLEM